MADINESLLSNEPSTKTKKAAGSSGGEQVGALGEGGQEGVKVPCPFPDLAPCPSSSGWSSVSVIISFIINW